MSRFLLKKIAATVGLAITLAGCSVGGGVGKTQMAVLVDNQSTKEHVISVLGQPDSKSVATDQNEEWTYGYTFIGIPFTSMKSMSKTTVFEFDDKGVLAKHYVRWYSD